MNITFSTDIEKETWESAMSAFPEANFLQSYNWGLFQESLGKRAVRLMATRKDRVIALASCVIEDAKRGRYVALAGGPLLDWSDTALVRAVIDQLKEIAHSHDCIFIRFRPQEIESNINGDLLTTIKTVIAPMHVTADLTLQLDLHKSDDELLKDMRKNTRSAIRKAEREGITTEVTQDINQIQQFFEEQKAVAERQGFIPFSYEFLQRQFEVFLQDNQVALVHAYTQERELLASAFVLFYNGEAVYHYGISTELNHRLPGSYACQWRAIAEAKTRGCTRYNFWGIAPKEEHEHRFAGVSLFKRGFGGFEVPYLEAQDIPLKRQYWVVYLFEYMRRKLRRL